MTWCETYTGVRFDFANPTPEMVNINDISHALSMQCRYNGHCQRFYSVAEHSVLVAQYLKKEGEPSQIQLAGLMHDAAEAYVGDMVRPAKMFPLESGGTFGDLFEELFEGPVRKVIMERFSLKGLESVFVKYADDTLLITEVQALMRSRGRGWHLTQTADEWVSERLIGLSPENAKRRFMKEWHNLRP